jgi:N-acetylmuramoyl-L-alanine amidase
MREWVRIVGVPVAFAVVATASAPGWTTYKVKRGDTLGEIAAAFDVSVAKLIDVNDLPGRGDLIYVGAVLRIPVPKKKEPGTTVTKTVLVDHKVALGDTLSGLAKKYGTEQARIVRANKLSSDVIRLGETLKIPVTKKVKLDNTFAGRTYPDAVVRAAAHNRALLAKKDVPDKAETKKLIVRTAKSLKVDPALALAVAWQESGWNQRAVSVANAIGVMQVIPSTGRWMETVLDRKLDLLDVDDNILAGVGLLRFLTDAAPLRQAVAGYYQGLGSVQRNGMYADTKRYVANVLSIRERYR